MFLVKVLRNFKDEVEKKDRKVGDTFIVKDIDRLNVLLGDNPKKRKCVEIIEAYRRSGETVEGEKINIFQGRLFYIGGIETFLYNLVKHFKNKDITVVTQLAAVSTVLKLSEYCNVRIHQPEDRYKSDVLILSNYDCTDILRSATAKKVYQMVHADWAGFKKLDKWKNFKWERNPLVDKIISVSDTAAKGLKETMGLDSEVIYNILEDDVQEETDSKIFITMSRATVEKGINRIIKMAEEFKKQGKNFVWFLCSSLEQCKPAELAKIKSIPEFIIIKPSMDNKFLINHCDYLVQLSDTESFCYSAYEALQRGVPVILTDFPEARNIVDDGVNGYIVDMELSNLDVEKIFTQKPTGNSYVDRCIPDKWEQVFKGEF